MGLMDKIKKMTGGADDPYNDNNYDDDYYNEFDDSYEDLDEEDVGGNQSGNGGNQGGYNIGGMNLSSAIEMKIIRPSNYKSASQIADHLLNKRTVVLNLENTDKETARRLIDFLAGVSYSIGGDLKPIAGNAYVITPDNVEITRDKLIDRKKEQQAQEEENFADF